MNSIDRPIVLIGGGGHASVLVDILKQQNREILAVISPQCIKSKAFSGMKHLRADVEIENYDPNIVLLVNGIGHLPHSNFKRHINESFIDKGYKFETIVAETACVSNYATLAEGVQVLHGAIVQAGAIINEHTIINTRSVIEHDCNIGSYNHVAPGATLCGQVSTASNVYIGAGSTVVQSVELGSNSIVGAGAVLNSSLDEDQICYPFRSEIS